MDAGVCGGFDAVGIDTHTYVHALCGLLPVLVPGHVVCSSHCASPQVLPSRRCTSHKTTLAGKIVTQKPGIYILNFDNGFSK